MAGLGQLRHIESDDRMRFSHRATSLNLCDLDQLPLVVNVEFQLLGRDSTTFISVDFFL